MEPVNNKELIKAVELLKATRVIKKDAEIVDMTGFSKSTVSNYLSGRVEASSNFIKKFEEVFKVSIFENKVLNTDKLSDRIILNLSESGRITAEAIKIQAENNRDVIAIFKATVNVPADNQKADDAKFSDLLEYIMKIGSGKQLWRSEQEAAAELSKRFHGKKAERKEVSTPTG